jgi:isopentenyl-diphosphate delta-isomerase
VDAGGVVENEVCPVYAARCVDAPTPHPDEVAEYRWIGLGDLRAAIAAAPWALSPWLLEQVPAIDAVDGWTGL